MQPTTPNGFSLLRTFAACHQLFKQFASEVRSRPGVSRVNHEFDLSPTTAGFRLTEYISPERIDGRWAFWQLEVIVTADASAVVNAESLNVNADGEPVRDIIAASITLSASEVAAGIMDIARQLCLSNPV